MKKTNHRKKGSSQFLVIGALLIISIITSFIVRTLQSDIYQMHAYALQMKAYYLADEAASAAVSALLADDDASLLNTGTYPMEDSMIHTASGTQIGISTIRMRKEVHDYYDESKDWVVIEITTSIPDDRAGRTGQQFSYSLTAMVLVDNPLIQLYHINPNDI